MGSVNDKDIKNAIKKCHYRKDKTGIDFCALCILPCEMTIDKGDCFALQKLFAEERKAKGE